MKLHLPLLLVLSASTASAQVIYPVGQEYGYSTSAVADSILGVEDSDSAANLFPISSFSSPSFSDSLSASVQHVQNFGQLSDPCIDTRESRVSLTHDFSLATSASVIEFEMDATSLHRQTFDLECCSKTTLSSIDTGSKAMFVPFDLPSNRVMTIEALESVPTQSVSNSPNGTATAAQDGLVTLRIFAVVNGTAVLPAVLDVNSDQFDQVQVAPIPAGSYAAVVIHDRGAQLSTEVTPRCPANFTATMSASEAARVRLSFE